MLSRTQWVISCLIIFLLEGTGVLLPYFWTRFFWLLVLNVLLFFLFFSQWRILKKNQNEVIDYVNKNAEESIREVLETMPVGIVRFDKKTKEKIWMNPFAEYIFTSNNEELSQREIQQIIYQNKADNHFLVFGKKKYFVYVYEAEGIIYFTDVTNEQRLKERLQSNRVVVGIISVDNYDDITENMDEKEVAILNSYITSEITDWLKGKQAFSRSLSREKYIFVVQFDALETMMVEKFDILKKIRNESIEKGKAITLSIGVTYGSTTMYSLGIAANNNLAIALVRGGDQAVVKEDSEMARPLYFGGTSNSITKRTRVRARAMAQALKGVMQESEEIYVMGHHFPDMDAFGASVGVAHIAKLYDIPVHIVLDEKQLIIDVQRCLEQIQEVPELTSLIISPQEAQSIRKKNSLLVMVDHSDPTITMNSDLYASFEKIVVIDHHRRGVEFPEKSLFSYVESSSSSASELVVELIQYISTSVKRLLPIEATVLFAGLVVDTKSFTVCTSSRTFDVASYLRGLGADSIAVQSLFEEDLSTYVKVNEIIVRSQFISEEIVIATGDTEERYENVFLAKAADILLGMTKIRTSFVLAKLTNGQIAISARSKDGLNVQSIMELLGGGGHFDRAAVQLEGLTIKEAKMQLIQAIQEKIEEEKSV